ncbi:hypothetical protein [Thermococcus sp. 21S7]|uniref:hypothetical protein n=1 Tax=Thermococcus sp. 21S7 TaxID=1638221 RepID=UPI00143B0BB2|nr:hypothetical protein [Thermococcus sp. 21S7]
MKMPRGFGGPMMGPAFGRRGFGWMWWGFGMFALLLLFARIAFLLLPFLLLGAVIHALLKR